MPPDRPSRRPDRSQLPDEFTPDTVRAMDMRTARYLARPGNGILSPEEQAAFDRSLREVMQGSADRLGRSLGKARRSGPPHIDPDLHRSYQRTRRRLDEQAKRARGAFPQLAEQWSIADVAELADGRSGATPEVDEPGVIDTAADAAAIGDEPDDDVSIATFESQIEETSTTLEILEQIAAIQQQQLEHQHSKVLSDTRNLFFALAVSVAVIVAGVAPLVQASSEDRRLILIWTAVVCAVAGVVYAIVRAVQSRSEEDQTD